MLILCNIFVALEHFILFNNFDKYHNFIYYRINIELMVHREFMSRCSHAASTLYYLYIYHLHSPGNVILNIGISSSMVSHFTKQGKNNNNIMLLSPLNPPCDKKCPKCNKNYINPQESTACEEGCSPDPTPLLIRVKTEADADKIISEIKKIFDDWWCDNCDS